MKNNDGDGIAAGPIADIRLHPGVTAGLIHNRYDVIVTGIATADKPIEAISLDFKDEVTALALYPPTAGNQQIFRLGLSQLRSSCEQTFPVQISVKTSEGHEHKVSFVLARDQVNPSVVRVVSGPISELPLQAKAFPPLLLYVETAAMDETGLLHVIGWAIAHAQIIAVQVLLDEERLGSAQFGHRRDDIADAYPGYLNARLSGFSFFKQLSKDAFPDAIFVEAIDLSGAVCRVSVPVEIGVALSAVPPEKELSPPAPEEPVLDPRRAIYLHCDSAVLRANRRLSVAGWVVCATGISSVDVTLDDEPLGKADLGFSRPDVANEYPGIPQAHHSGFLFEVPLQENASEPQNVILLARNGMDDVRTLIVAVTSASDEQHQTTSVVPGNEMDFRLELDNPVVIEGVVPDPVISRLVVEGWALARSGVEGIEVFLDGQTLGPAYYGTARRDVEAAFPDWEDALRCGYIFHFPQKTLKTGPHQVLLRLKAKNGATFDREFRIEVQQSEESEDYATIRRRMTRAEMEIFNDLIARHDIRPRFLLAMAVPARVPAEKVTKTLRALRAQVYPEWHLKIITERTAGRELRNLVNAEELSRNVSFVTATTDLTELVGPVEKPASEFVAVLMPGDELGVDALVEFATAYGRHPESDFFYADEDRVSPVTQTREPFFKPDWSPDLLLASNYIGRPWFSRPALLHKAGITSKSLLLPQGDYDAVLRCTEQLPRIRHLQKLLCRRHEDDRADTGSERRVLESALTRRGIVAELLPGCAPGIWRVKRTVRATGKVSIIIPTCAAQGHVKKCLETLRSKTAYQNFEIICIDNIPADMPEWKELIRQGCNKIVDIPEAFNWSRFNNKAAEQAEGEYLLFLNDDIEIERADWLDILLEHAQRPEVGIVGPQLLYPDRKVQHAGIFLTTLGAGRHSFRFLAEDDPGYFGLALTQRNSIAVTGACMLMRREVFEQIGRFDEAHEVVNNDVDCCLRAWQAGFNIVYEPHAQLIHHELASRAKLKDVFDAGHFARQWRTLYNTGDPFFSTRLTKFADEYRPDTEPARLIAAGGPLFRMDEIQRILVVKLDHIGDLITAVPALRRLRRLFPHARIHLLASGSAKAFLAEEGCVDEFIEFEFFHARSGLGQKELTEDDLRALGKRLEPYRLDLAMDLRKQVETRHILQFIPARFRAGYNHMGRFPWLDIAPEWEGDNQLRRKQSHVSDDLMRLVDTIAAAGDADRLVLARAAGGPVALPPGLPQEAKTLFSRPVVAVHPGVGAIMRQWIPEYFTAVIDLLIEKNHVNVVVIGGRDEAKLAEQVVEGVVNQDHVVSLAGRTSLSELTAVLQSCALYLGNNSGPKHIAAALGVPTVGIHSGVVDAAEWGPVGPRAVAVQKNMVCMPCYLVKPEDCVRDMACLKRLEPAVVHQYCEMMLARVVPAAVSGPVPALAARPATPMLGRVEQPKPRPAAGQPASKRNSSKVTANRRGPR
jgi:ADP-heptose:LPS heptosyltransferase/GT2 family glycosyltransferase